MNELDSNTIIAKINHIKILLINILGDYYDKTLETNGLFLHEIPHTYSIKIHEQVNPSFFKLINYYSDSIEIIENNELFQKIESILLESITIESSLREFKTLLNKIKEKINSMDILLVKEDELNEAYGLLLNHDTKPKQFYRNDEEEELFQLLTSSYCTNAAINSNLFVDGSEIEVSDLEKIDPRLAFHAKKTALDQMCMSLFKEYNNNYDNLYYMNTLSDKNPLNELVKNPLKKNEKAFVLINMNDMEGMLFPKFIELMDHKTGATCYVKEMKQNAVQQKIPCMIANNNVIVNTQVTLAVILTEIKEYQIDRE